MNGITLRRLMPSPLCLLGALLCLYGGAAVPAVSSDGELAARVDRVLARTPLIDGHNDLPWKIRDRFASQLGTFDLHDTIDLVAPKDDSPALMTDIRRLRTGRMGRPVLVGLDSGDHQRLRGGPGHPGTD